MIDNKRFKELTAEHMKPAGKSDTVRGELIRAVNRIGYRFYNDGDYLGIGYGNETCNAAGRYIGKHGNEEMVDCLAQLWDEGIHDSYYPTMPDFKYEKWLENLVDATVRYADSNDPKLDQEPTDMHDLREDEDYHYDDDLEEDDDWDEEDEWAEEWEEEE